MYIFIRCGQTTAAAVHGDGGDNNDEGVAIVVPAVDVEGSISNEPPSSSATAAADDGDSDEVETEKMSSTDSDDEVVPPSSYLFTGRYGGTGQDRTSLIVLRHWYLFKNALQVRIVIFI